MWDKSINMNAFMHVASLCDIDFVARCSLMRFDFRYKATISFQILSHNKTSGPPHVENTPNCVLIMSLVTNGRSTESHVHTEYI